MTDCVVTGDRLEDDMWRLECTYCGWTSLVPDGERVGATLAHLYAEALEPERTETPAVPDRERRVLDVRRLLLLGATAVVVYVVASLILMTLT